MLGNLNVSYQDKLSSILSEETRWAEEANEQRRTQTIILICILAVGAIVSLFFIIKIIKYIRMLSKIEKTKPEIEYDYYREFPDEKASPGEAAYLYYFDKKYMFSSNITKIVSATILNLALKKAISFEQTAKDDIVIVINQVTPEREDFTEDEMKIYELLEKVYSYTSRKSNRADGLHGITMKDIEKYARKNDTQFLGKIESIEKIVEKVQKTKGNYEGNSESSKWNATSIVYFVLAFIGIFFIGVVIVPIIWGILSIVCGILCNKIANKLRMLTQKGANEQEQWKALKRYMEEYSLLKEREVPELVLWEKYLVYATAFGIADKVLKQLKVTYPQIADENYMINNGYTYLYMMNRVNFNMAIGTGIQRAYTSRNKCESCKKLFEPEADGGGGFSGGGGRPEEVGGRNGRKIKL